MVVMLIVLEAVLRTTHLFGARVSWTEPDPEIGWRFTPGHEYWVQKENDHPITGRINSLGYRDRERSRDKPDGTYRVAVVGDSYVEALQVELDSTFVAVAARELDDRLGIPVEVMNLGRSGMTITEERTVVKNAGEALDADLIVLVFVPLNDIADMTPATTDNLMRPFARTGGDGTVVIDTGFSLSPGYRARTRVNWLKQYSALVSLLAERYNAWRMARRRSSDERPSEGIASASGVTGALSLCTDSPDSVYVAAYDLWKRVFLDTAEGLRGAGGPEILLTTVPIVYTTEDIARFRDLDPTFDPGFFDRDLSAMYTPYLRMQDAFESRYRATGRPLHWAHWNYAGHRLVGMRLARRIAVMHGH
jgi:hypothetical protein